MLNENKQSTSLHVQEVINRLQSPIEDVETLFEALSSSLAALNILPPRFIRYNTRPLPQQGISVSKHVPLLQRALIESVLPAWEHLLDEQDAYILALQYFAPDTFSCGRPAAKDIALYAYSTILSLPLTQHSVRLLVHLSKAYPIDVLWSVAVSGRNATSSRHAVTWEDCVRNVCAVPAKVANALGPRGSVPEELQYGPYFNSISQRFQLLLDSLGTKPSPSELASIGYLLNKLVNIGVFPATKPASPSQPSFFNIILPSIRQQLEPSSQPSSIWPRVLNSVSSITTLQTISTSLLSHLTPMLDMDATQEARALVKREAALLNVFVGPLTEDSEIFDDLAASALGRHWSVGHARILSCLAAGCGTYSSNTTGIERLLSKVVEIWSTPDHIKHSLLAGHRYFTAFLLILLSYLTAVPMGNGVHPAIAALSLSPAFISAITTYISHLDSSVRRCGMLVAEEVARACGKKLDFGDWDGDKDGRQWSREMRTLMKERDAEASDILVYENHSAADAEGSSRSGTEVHQKVEAEPSHLGQDSKPKITMAPSGYDSDDSLTGYMSEPSSSRSASPTPSELDEIEKDPTLRVGKITIHRPVYLAQLGEMIRPLGGVRSEEDQEEPKRIEVALDAAEELIRRKRAYGTELEENAVNLAYSFLGLQDKYDIEGFDQKRQGALTALVACCPKKAAQSLIEEFFRNQYSTDQRFALLNSLVFGARELAGIPTPPSTTTDSKRIAFPTKQLPPALHKKYVTATDQARTVNAVQYLLEDVTRNAIARTKDAAEDKVPEIARERRLRLSQPTKITEVTRTSDLSRGLQSVQLQPKPVIAFTEVAAEYFICPLINRFWLFLRDEQSRESRTANQPNLHQYKADGTGFILSALVLSQFVRSLALLVHMARNAPEFLAIIAPDALELAVTVGTRPLTQVVGLNDGDGPDETGEMGRKDKEAAVLTSSLELAVVSIDGCLELDDGRSLGLEHTTLLLAAGEWAGEILGYLEKGERVLGGGGEEEIKLRRAAAGLALKVDELRTRWRRSMVEL